MVGGLRSKEVSVVRERFFFTCAEDYSKHDEANSILITCWPSLALIILAMLQGRLMQSASLAFATDAAVTCRFTVKFRRHGLSQTNGKI